MFEFLLWATMATIAASMIYAYAGSRDVFHPLMFLGPMLMFLYGWMPMKLSRAGGLDGFFQPDQLFSVQCWNLLGVACLIQGCLTGGCRVKQTEIAPNLGASAARILLNGGMVIGFVGLAAWMISIVNVGGFHEAFSRPYSGGWDDSGYIRDGSLLIFPGFLLILTAVLQWRIQVSYLIVLAGLIGPWIAQAVLTSRRGPTFMIGIVIATGYYMNRRRRPRLVVAASAGLALGLLMLFLVSNRGSIYLGSEGELTTDITTIVEKPDAGNEYIYGAGSILSAEQREHFYWGRRYLAEIFVRPIPSAVWPNKYEDVGLPELMHNSGTGEGFSETLGWNGAEGSAPGLIADLWIEFRWGSFIALWSIGFSYAGVWRRTYSHGGPWVTQYIVMAALSVYMVMQTMEAVIFRLLLLSVPIWIVWIRARRAQDKDDAELAGLMLPDLSPFATVGRSPWSTPA